jgi:hypothetical protein
MVMLIVAVSLGWIMVSIVVGLGLGAILHRLDTPQHRGGSFRRWMVASPTRNNGRPLLVLARITNSPTRRVHRP